MTAALRPPVALSARVSPEKVVFDAEAVSRTLSRIAHEIIEGNPELDRVALIGIQTRVSSLSACGG